MKRNLKVLSVFSLAVLVLSICLALAACGDESKLKGTVTVAVEGQTDVEVNLSKTDLVVGDSVASLLNWLNQEEKLACNLENSTFGAYLISIGQLNPTGNQYIGVFVNDESLKDTSAFALPNKEINGETFFYSGVGIGDIELTDGLAVYFCILEF